MNQKTRRETLMDALNGEESDDTTELASSGSESETIDDGSAGEQQSTEISADGQQPTEKSSEKEPKIKWTGEKDKKAGEKDPYAKEKVAADKQDPNKPKPQGQEADKDGQQQTQQELKAPNSWKPAAREEWKTIGKTAQAEIVRREQQIQRTLSETANIRKFSNDLANVIAPHAHLIRAQNSTPLKAIDNLMRTSAGLTTGSAQQKAQLVAQICRNFNVDVKELDSALAQVLGQGGEQTQQNGNLDVETAVQKAMQPFNAFMGSVQQQKQQREQEIQQNAESSVEDFVNDPKNEFATDLADEMADIMEIKAQRGQKVTIQQAYQIAIRQNPDIEAIVNQRKAASRVPGGNVSRARKAASTIHGSPSGNASGDKSGPKSRREVLAEAMNAGNQ